MRRFIKIIICFLICVCFGNIKVFASTNTFERTEDNNYLVNGRDITITSSNLEAILETPAVDASEKVYDFANLYTDSQEEELYSLITEYIGTYDLDLVVVTINSNPKSSTKDYAHDFYDYNDFGLNESYDGVLFLIDMQNREFYMVTTGEGVTMYTDARIDGCLDAVFNYIAEGNYYKGTTAFIDKISNYAMIGVPDEFGNEPELKGIAKLKTMSWSSITIFSIISTVIVIFIFISNNRLVHKANSAKNYLSTADIKVVDEIFLGKNVHRSARYHDSGGGGSSGGNSRTVSSGSSGRSHGGGGRSF